MLLAPSAAAAICPFSLLPASDILRLDSTCRVDACCSSSCACSVPLAAALVGSGSGSAPGAAYGAAMESPSALLCAAGWQGPSADTSTARRPTGLGLACMAVVPNTRRDTCEGEAEAAESLHDSNASNDSSRSAAAGNEAGLVARFEVATMEPATAACL